MVIKYIEKTNSYFVSHHRRHPVTRKPMSLRRRGIKSKAEARRVYDRLVVDLERKLHKSSSYMGRIASDVLQGSG